MPLPFIISIPHCASQVPEDIKSTMILSENEILDSVDFGTSEIFGRIPAQEIIMAQWSRLVADPNRAPDRLDPKGVVAWTDYHGRPVFRSDLQPDRGTTIERVRRYHRPYHEALGWHRSGRCPRPGTKAQGCYPQQLRRYRRQAKAAHEPVELLPGTDPHIQIGF